MSEDILANGMDQVNNLINNPGPESFPLDVLPDVYSEMATAVARSIGTAADYTAVAALATVGAAAGHVFEVVYSDDLREFAALWYLLVGESSAGKSPAMFRMFRPLELVEDELWKQWKSQVDEWKAAGEAGQKPRLRRIMASDATVEALGLLMQENGSIALVVDEGRGIVGGFDKYRQGRGGDKEHYLQAWSQGPVRVDRRTRDPLFVPRGCLPIITTTQPRFAGLFLREDGSGFAARWLATFPIVPTPELGSPSVPKLTSKRYTRAVLNILDARLKATEPIGVGLSNEAESVFDYAVFRLRLAARESGDEGVSAFLGKARDYILRFSLALHLMHWSAEGGPLGRIPAETVMAALRLFRYFQRQREEFLRINATPDEIQRLIGWMKTSDRQTVTTRQVSNSLNLKAKDAERIMLAAGEAGLGDTWEEPIRGRGGRRLVFRLRVHEPQHEESDDENDTTLSPPDMLPTKSTK